VSDNLLTKYPFPNRERYGDAAGTSPALASSPLPGAGEDLSRNQKIALLKMRRSDWSKAVVSRLKIDGDVRISGADYVACRELGLAVQKGSFHVLTLRGRWQADQAAMAIAREIGIHAITYDLGRFGAAACAKCTCGWRTFRTRAIDSFVTLLCNDARHHLEHVSVASASENKSVGSPAQQRDPCGVPG
jgi:hypothetical protein